MCGISGFIQRHTEKTQMEQIIVQMMDKIIHRGPDDKGYWLDHSIGLALGHRRLAIQDLSTAGHQPMPSACRRYVIVFNGEIYNHLALRALLGPHPWRGHSDTETLLACFSVWGMEKTLSNITGMFSLALFDKETSKIFLIRDRLGEKPLYYGWQGNCFLFSSELKSLTVHPEFQKEIDRDSLAAFLRFGYCPTPNSIYKGIKKLPPGHYIQLNLANATPGELMDPLPYWSLSKVIAQGIHQPFQGSDSEAVDALHRQLSASVTSQMLSDVPLGAFLSGGVDSSTIVALMQARHSRPVQTFTIGFDEPGYNEAEHAKAVAQHLGTQHTELYVRAEDALAVVPCLPGIYCEPFADSSQIPTYLISRLAKQSVTVALTGDGGDELFAGYNRYLTACQAWNRLQQLPLVARMTLAKLLSALPPAMWDSLFSLASPLLPSKYRLRTPGDKLQKLAGLMAFSSEEDFYKDLVSHWKKPTNLVIGSEESASVFWNLDSLPEMESFEQWMMAMDTRTYLADDILAKVDRAAMATSLETRVPLLDHRVVELAWKMPLNLKIRNNDGKWLLRQVLYQHVPRELIERPKMGFAIPLDTWLRGPLREWAESLLAEERLRREGYLRPEPIRRAWQEHLSGKRNWQGPLWNVLMFQAWLEHQ
ncbi:asparagine synthase (glutamine-hydrolyzing) [Pseudomonas aeruginosa]|uniref:asparagine synthase (glutamine-hydrolyzing) n=1 Tax=Pseudomonas aeruginosa TaxID=287 RepID=UPI00214721E8|nr:asparagine synthase (glutamine-hydrolyzing) [Pseudomonas aeruginosa]HEJ1103244.1 asparagine synthase (glutamine-hydrolyzing) [Pseudomonas aeruginosa]